MSGEHIRGIPRTYEKEITLADTPYTLSLGYNCVKVDTTGGNVRVNLPDVNYPIDVIKTSSDAYIVTIWVGGTQIGEVAGELSVVTIENAEVTQDEPWYPYDAIVGIAGDEVIAKNMYGKCPSASWRGAVDTDSSNIFNALLSASDIFNITIVPSTTKFTLTSSLEVVKENQIIESAGRASLESSGFSHTYPGRNVVFTSPLDIDIMHIQAGMTTVRGIKFYDCYNAIHIDPVDFSHSVSEIYIRENGFKAIRNDAIFVDAHAGGVYGVDIRKNLFCATAASDPVANSYIHFETGENVNYIIDTSKIVDNALGGKVLASMFFDVHAASLIIEQISQNHLEIGIAGFKNFYILSDALYDTPVIQFIDISGNYFYCSSNSIDSLYVDLLGGYLYPLNFRNCEFWGGNITLRATSGIVIDGPVFDSCHLDIGTFTMYGPGGGVGWRKIQSPKIVNSPNLHGTISYDGVHGLVIRDNNYGSLVITGARSENVTIENNNPKLSATLTITPTTTVTNARYINNEQYKTSARGSSTGTGSEQTIAHGLVSAPSRVVIEIPSIGYKGSCTSDATNIKPRVKSGLAFNWCAEV